MKKMKRYSMLVLTLVCMVVIAMACSKNDDSAKNGKGPNNTEGKTAEQQDKTEQPVDNFNPQGYPVVNEPIKLKIMGAKGALHIPWDQMTLFKKLTELTNIAFEFDTPPSEAYSEKLNLAFATGSLPDVLFGANLPVDKEVTYGQQGLLIPLEDLIDKYAPNFLKILEANPGLRQSITAPDGHIYSLPRINAREDIPNNDAHTAYPRIWINVKWLKKLELQPPETTDEFLAVMKAFKEGDPNGNQQADEIPITAFQMDIRGVMMNWFGFVGTTGQLIDVKDSKVRYAPMESEYRNYLSFMHSLYLEGLLDRESYSQTTQQRIAKGNQNQLGAYFGLAPFLVVGNELDPDYDVLLPLTSEVNGEQMTSVQPLITRGTFAITKSNKYPEATMRLVDYMYSDEGSDLGQFGIEGVNWKLNEDKTSRIFIGEGGANSQELRAKATPDAGTAIPRNQSELGARLSSMEMVEKAKDIDPTRYHFGKEFRKLIPYAHPVYPMIYFTLEEQKEMNVLQADILTYVEQMEAKFIIGDEPIANIDKFTDTLKKMNVDRYIQIHQDAYNRWAESGK